MAIACVARVHFRQLLAAGLLAVAAVSTGCSDTGPTAPATTTVELVYLAQPATAPPADYPVSCVRSVLRVHASPSWKGPRFYMEEADAGRWRITVSDAPVGRDLTVGIADPRMCFKNQTGAATQSVFANGVRLLRVVNVRGEGPRLAFRVAADGTVIP
jgi:hypothetical protein